MAHRYLDLAYIGYHDFSYTYKHGDISHKTLLFSSSLNKQHQDHTPTWLSAVVAEKQGHSCLASHFPHSCCLPVPKCICSCAPAQRPILALPPGWSSATLPSGPDVHTAEVLGCWPGLNCPLIRASPWEAPTWKNAWVGGIQSRVLASVCRLLLHAC